MQRAKNVYNVAEACVTLPVACVIMHFVIIAVAHEAVHNAEVFTAEIEQHPWHRRKVKTITIYTPRDLQEVQHAQSMTGPQGQIIARTAQASRSTRLNFKVVVTVLPSRALSIVFEQSGTLHQCC